MVGDEVNDARGRRPRPDVLVFLNSTNSSESMSTPHRCVRTRARQTRPGSRRCVVLQLVAAGAMLLDGDFAGR